LLVVYFETQRQWRGCHIDIFSIPAKYVKSAAPSLAVQSFVFGRLAKLTVFSVAFLCPSGQIPV